MIENYDETRNAVHPEKPVMAKTGIALALAMGAIFSGCSEIGGSAGTSEEAEGIVAIANKKISGAAQKGPLVKGSEVVLRETSAEGNLEPTGREYTTVTINDKGDFNFDSLNLVSQYVLLSAEGYYIHDGEVYFSDDNRSEEEKRFSECPMRLDAVSDLRKRETVNINLLTHFEYKRVLNLIKSGKNFVEAKRQASTEVMNAFGVDVDVSSSEDLNIFNTSDADRTLFNISLLLDGSSSWEFWDGTSDEWGPEILLENIDCSKLQAYIDAFANDFADDGVLGDSIMQDLATQAYRITGEYSHMEDIDESDMRKKDRKSPGSYEELMVMKKKYEFSKLLFLNYMGVELCTEDLWGEYREFHKPIMAYDKSSNQMIVLQSGYLLCNGSSWEIKTSGYVDSLKMKIDHESGTMIDPRDGNVYKTVSFEIGGKRYEWMAEDLKYDLGTDYMWTSIPQNEGSNGIYKWTSAMQIDPKYMTGPVEDGVIDVVHQGICPDGWHISSVKDWNALLAYVGGALNLLNENWRGAAGVHYDRLDFNLLPMEDNAVYYHTYTHQSFHVNIQAQIDTLKMYYDNAPFAYDEDFRGGFNYSGYLSNLEFDNKTFTIYLGFDSARKEPREKARVRCVKN